MKNTGALLKAKRESSKLSLSEVALATKINPKILAAIENGDDTALPAKTILRGFLKSYALFLKMDVDEVLRTFQEETGAPPPIVKSVAEPSVESPRAANAEAPPQPRRRVSDDSSTGMRTAAVIVIVVLIGLIIGVRELIEKYQREKVVEQVVDLKVTPVETPVTTAPETKTEGTESATEAKADEKAVTETAKTEDAKPEASAEQKPAAVSAPAVAGPVAPGTGVIAPLAPPVPAPAPPAPPAPETKTAETKPAEVKPAEPKPEAPKPATDTKPTTTKAAKHEIILEALDKVEVKFQIKGEVKRVSLGPTQVHTIHADQPLTIDLSDGGAVNVILDGRERGVPGDLGKPKTIKIP